MGQILAHSGSGDLIVAGLILLIPVLAAGVAGTIVGLLCGIVLRLFMRGRHLLWALPAMNVGVYLLSEHRISLLVRNQPQFPGWMRAAILVGLVIGTMLAAGIVAGVGRVLAGGSKAKRSGAREGAGTPPPLPFGGMGHENPAPDMVGGLKEGFTTPGVGFAFMAAHPRLWRYAIIPVAWNTLITSIILLALLVGGVVFAVKLHPVFPQAWWGWVLEILTVMALLFVAGVLALGAGMLLNSILCGHFYAKLAREVEILLGMRPEEIHEIPLGEQIGDGLRDFGWLLLVNSGLLALNVIPVLGTVAAVVLGAWINGFVLGMDYLEFPMSLRAMRRADQRAFAKRHRWQTIGLGVAVFLLNLIPLVGSVLLATACTGAVVLYRRLEEAEKSPVVRGIDWARA